jgi:WD40 repeat protein
MMDSAKLKVRVLASAELGTSGKKESDINADCVYENETSSRDGEDGSFNEGKKSVNGHHEKKGAQTIERLQESPQRYVSAIQEARLSPDGTCIFTIDYDRMFTVYPIDTNILQEPSTRSLNPYAVFRSADPLWAFSVNPYFDLNEANTATVLVSRRDQYISLHNALWDLSGDPPLTPVDEAEDDVAKVPSTRPPVNISTKLVSYKLIDHLTEAVIAPSSLTHTHSGTHFFAGEQDRIALFDMEYANDPISKIQTIPSKRNKLKGGGYGFKGVISALSISPSTQMSRTGVLAAGSRTRYVGLYDAEGSGEEITHFSLPGQVNGRKIWDGEDKELMGAGVSELKWSACGKYLFVAERMSDVVVIYDIRRFERALGYCGGRKAMTTKKMGFDVWSTGDAYVQDVVHEIWAGGTDGHVRIWRDPHLKEGRLEAEEVVQVSDAPIASTLVHPSGSLVIAASGCQDFGIEESDKGRSRGGGHMPKFKEWGGLKILGLGSG